MTLGNAPYQKLVDGYTYHTYTDGFTSGYVATVEEFPGRSSKMSWPAGAIADLKKKIISKLEEMDRRGEDLPDAQSPTGFYIRDTYAAYLDCDTESATKVLHLAATHGQTGDPGQQAWVIDQLVRSLTGKHYDEFIEAVSGIGTDTEKDWDEGVPPTQSPR
jgi:hypothetical protein